MHISAKADYALRALLTLAGEPEGQPITADVLAGSQHLPLKFLENILVDLKRIGLVTSQRGAGGGYRLGRPAELITAAEVIRALEGPLAEVRGLRPEAAIYEGPAEHLQDVWVAVRAGLRAVLEHVTLADIVTGEFPSDVTRLTTDPDAWLAH